MDISSQLAGTVVAPCRWSVVAHARHPGSPHRRGPAARPRSDWTSPAAAEPAPRAPRRLHQLRVQQLLQHLLHVGGRRPAAGTDVKKQARSAAANVATPRGASWRKRLRAQGPAQLLVRVVDGDPHGRYRRWPARPNARWPAGRARSATDRTGPGGESGAGDPQGQRKSAARRHHLRRGGRLGRDPVRPGDAGQKLQPVSAAGRGPSVTGRVPARPVSGRRLVMTVRHLGSRRAAAAGSEPRRPRRRAARGSVRRPSPSGRAPPAPACHRGTIRGGRTTERRKRFSTWPGPTRRPWEPCRSTKSWPSGKSLASRRSTVTAEGGFPDACYSGHGDHGYLLGRSR